MSSDPKINLRGVNAVMKSDAVSALLLREARRIASRAGDGFGVRADNRHRWIARAFVSTDSLDAARAEARDKRLIRAVYGG